MKKFYLLLCCIFCAVALLAQPTLQYPQNTPIVGDVAQIQFVATNGLSTGQVGANVSWDYSGLTLLDGGQITAINPSEAPAGAQFPASNVALSMGDTIFTFALTNADGYHYMGSQSITGTFPSVLVYSDYRTFIKFPFTYEDTYFDTYKGVSTTSVADIHVSALTEIFADSWGTLILPTGTYTNVLRTITVDVEVDSVFVMGSYVKSFAVGRTQYSWFAENSTGPLMSIEILSNQYYGYTDTVAYYMLTSSGIGNDTHLQASGLQVFPNPADDHVMVEFDITPNVAATISIVNQVGQFVISRNVTNTLYGSVSERIDISALPPGIYFANVNCNCGKQLTNKFVIR